MYNSSKRRTTLNFTMSCFFYGSTYFLCEKLSSMVCVAVEWELLLMEEVMFHNFRTVPTEIKANDN